MFEYDNLAKWAAFFRRMPSWLKVCVIAGGVSLGSILAYIQLGPLRQLQSDNTKLKSDLSVAEKTVSDLKDKKDELHRENLFLKGLVSPLQKKAEELYPELESAAALTKLAEDLETVRSLATKDIYKPLKPAQRDALLKRLGQIREEYSAVPKIVIAVEQGNSSRMRVAGDLKGFLTSAGYATDLRPQQTFRVFPARVHETGRGLGV